MSVEFTDNSVKVKAALDDAAIAYLYEAAGELEAQTKRNQTRVDTAETKNKWTYMVDESKGEAVVGNPLENAIWEEFGTGEYALNGDGRKGGWFYKDKKGEGHYTHGKTPLRAFFNAFTSLKPKLIRRAEQIMKERMND
jgi:hypothetical protein